MDPTKYIWMDGEFVNWEDAKIHVLTHGLHYGSAVFEGVRFYDTPKGPAIFRLEDHTNRLFYSAKALEMEVPYSKDEINNATVELLQKNKIPAGYIRPLIYYGYGKMGLNPSQAPVNVSIANWAWGAYLGKDAVKIKVSKYIRIHPDSTISDAKISGHYENSILASLEIKKAGYDEALFLDFEGNVAEGPGENIFIVKNSKLFTPALGSILGGITRDSIIKIAKDLGYEVEEKVLTLDEVKSADECFYTGTAAEVTAVEQVDEDVIGAGGVGEITAKLKEAYWNAIQGKDEKYEDWLTYIK